MAQVFSAQTWLPQLLLYLPYFLSPALSHQLHPWTVGTSCLSSTFSQTKRTNFPLDTSIFRTRPLIGPASCLLTVHLNNNITFPQIPKALTPSSLGPGCRTVLTVLPRSCAFVQGVGDVYIPGLVPPCTRQRRRTTRTYNTPFIFPFPSYHPLLAGPESNCHPQMKKSVRCCRFKSHNDSEFIAQNSAFYRPN